MRYIAAYLLATIGGDANPSKDKITAILNAAGVPIEGGAIDALLAKLAGKTLAAVISDGTAKLSVVGGGGGGGGSAAPAASSAPAAAPAPVKKEEEAVALSMDLDDIFG
jgi:large subunit ribosomal protein LP2